MSDYGLVVNARGAFPDGPECYRMGLYNGAWLRTIVYSFDDLDRTLTSLGGVTSLNVCALLNSETEGVGNDYAGWRDVVGRFCLRFAGRVRALECANELDLLGVPPEVAARLIRQAIGPAHAAGMKVIATSVAGPQWQEYLAALAMRWGTEPPDYACLHPYGQRADSFPPGWGFGEIEAAVNRARDLTGLPVAVTESGIKIGDAGGEQGQAEYARRWVELVKRLPPELVPFACYFAWRDDIGGPGERSDQAFGLRREDGSPRVAWRAFRMATGQAQDVPQPAPAPRFQLGFLDGYNAAPQLVGQPLEDERGGVKGLSFQLTTEGFLTAANIVGRGWVITFFKNATRQRFLLNAGRWEPI